MNRIALWTGIAIRSLVLGALLLGAIVALLGAGGATVFRYQGY